MSAQARIPMVVMRGGTSRAVIFKEADLPPGAEARTRILLSALGSPDPYSRQVDGLGGAISSTSKAAIIGPATAAGADVNYTFGQVSVAEPIVDLRGNCGNISSAVGPFAIDEGLVRAEEPITHVRIFNTNTRKSIVAHVPVARGRAQVEGDFPIPGVPGTGAKIALEFLDPGGAVTPHLFPTGRVLETLEVPGIDRIEATLIDVTNPLVLIRAADLGMKGTEAPQDVDNDPDLMARLEAIRAVGAVAMGIVATPEEASRSPAVPKIAFVGSPATYQEISGGTVRAEETDLVGRVISMGKTHRAYALTAAMATAVAAVVEGTVAFEVASPRHDPHADIRLGHAAGVLPIGARISRQDGWRVEKVITYRTARRIADGYIYVPEAVLRLP